MSFSWLKGQVYCVCPRVEQRPVEARRRAEASGVVKCFLEEYVTTQLRMMHKVDVTGEEVWSGTLERRTLRPKSSEKHLITRSKRNP